MKRILINLKDYLGERKNREFLESVKDYDLTVFPSMPYLYIYKEGNLKIGSQDISEYNAGAYTGNVSGDHLKDFNVSVVLLNHRENKVNDLKTLHEKINRSLESDITPIICIESLEEYESLNIHELLNKNIMIAFEPNYDMNIDIISEEWKELKTRITTIPIIYGGNITASNIQKIDQELEADGYLISRSALNISELNSIVTTINKEDF